MFKKFAMAAICLTASQAGFGAVEVQDQDKDFVWYCESDEATKAQKVTVKSIFSLAEIDQSETSCREAFEKINAMESFELFYNEYDYEYIEDFRPLKGLDNIVALYCDSLCTKNSAATIPELPNLKVLALMYVQLDQMPDLVRFPKITELSVLGNPIAKIDKIDQLKPLKVLVISQTKIDDLTFLQELTHLESLAINSMPEGTLSTLPVLADFLYVGLGSNGLESFDVLHKLPNLVYVGLSLNKFKTLEGLSHFSNLLGVDVSDNEITRIQSEHLPQKLVSLTAQGLKLESYDFLKEIKGMQYLDVESSNFDDWNSIQHLSPTLIQLVATDTPLKNKVIPEGTIEAWPKLESIWLDKTNINSLAFFKQIDAPKLNDVLLPDIQTKTEENCPTSGVPEVVAEFCKQY